MTQTHSFGAVAVELGFCTLEQVKECIEVQVKMRALGIAPKKVGELLLEKGIITEEQARKIFWVQGQRGGHVEIAGYRVTERLGEGSMGMVYKATQISMDRPVALKVLSPRLAANAKFVERFFREARAVARLNHPNIIQGIDVGVSNGVHYFAMEYVDGTTVGNLLARGGAFDEKRALRIIIQIAQALEHANQNNLVHRDVKPDNIMLVSHTGVAKLCDLGVAVMLQPGVAGTSDGVVGTPNYISPEQVLGEELDIRTDIYALGASFYHMITGGAPFDKGEDGLTIMAKQVKEPLVPPNVVNPLVSESAAFITTKMMKKPRDERYQTPADLLIDLKFLEDEGALPNFKSPAPAAPTAPGTRPRGHKRSSVYRLKRRLNM
ncbi:MAG: serine/threonine-protein kinase [Planctomycetota bacterium]|nr:serine/threonine-protein kinase [Planctomycetota bacterium]